MPAFLVFSCEPAALSGCVLTYEMQSGSWRSRGTIAARQLLRASDESNPGYSRNCDPGDGPAVAVGAEATVVPAAGRLRDRSAGVQVFLSGYDDVDCEPGDLSASVVVQAVRFLHF